MAKTIAETSRDLVMSAYGLTFQSQMNAWQQDFTKRIESALESVAREQREQAFDDAVGIVDALEYELPNLEQMKGAQAVRLALQAKIRTQETSKVGE